MDLVFIPRLQNMALTKVAAAICENPDIHPFTLNSIQFSEAEVEMHIMDIIRQLTLPEPVGAFLLMWVKTLRQEIKSWRSGHENILCSAVNRLIKFCWRHDGSIDSAKTAQALVKNDDVNCTIRFRLATCYFLEENVKGLWEMIKSLHLSYSFYSMFRYPPFLAVWWPWYLSGGSRELIDIVQHEIFRFPVFYFLTMLFNAEASFRSFVEKLPIDNRLEWMRNITRDFFLTRDLVLYCLSGPLRNQKMEVFRENAFKVLLIFLTWPLQIMFMDLANRLWDHLSEENFKLLFILICRNIREARCDFNYSQLKEEFWYDSPLPYREYVINRQMNRDEQILAADIEGYIPPLFRN